MNIYDVCKEFEKALEAHFSPSDIVEVPLVCGYSKEEVESHRVYATHYENHVIFCFYYEEDKDCIFIKI